jgi:hypothetical protein
MVGAPPEPVDDGPLDELLEVDVGDVTEPGVDVVLDDGGDVGHGRYKTLVDVPAQPVGQVHGPVVVVVNTDWPTQEHGQVTVSNFKQAGTAQNDNPGGGGGVQPGALALEVIVGQTTSPVDTLS